MAQTVQILRASPPITLLPGALSVELGAQTRLWVGSGTGNRLLLSSDPVDVPVISTAFVKIAGSTMTGFLTLSGPPTANLHAATKAYVDTGDTTILNSAKAYTDAGDTTTLNAAKAYADAQDNTIKTTYLPLGGGTVTGALTVPYIHYTAPGGLSGYFAFGWDGQYARVYIDGGGPYGVVPTSLPLPISQGGTGTTTASQALINLGGVSTAGGAMGNLTTTGIHVTGNAIVDGPLSASGATLGGLTVNGGSGFNGDVTVGGNLLAGNTTVAALTASQGHVSGLFGVDGLTTLNAVNINGNAHFTGACQVDHGIEYPSYGLAAAATNIGFGFSYNTPTVLWLVTNDTFAGTILVNTSDERLKRDIRPVTVDPLAMLCRVQLRAFNQLSTRLDPADGVQHRDVGFIAQQLREAIPDAVVEPPPDIDGAYLSLDPMPLIAYCVGAIQQLEERLHELEEAVPV